MNAPIVLSGPAVIERPRGTLLFELEWGTEPGQVGHGVWEQGEPSQNPLELSTSPDERTIAILDYANSRVELLARDGRIQDVLPISSDGGLADVCYGPGGRVFVLSYGGAVLQLPAKVGEATLTIPIDWQVAPYELVPDGANLWVSGAGPTLYKVFGPSGPLSASEQSATSQQTVPVGLISFQVEYENTTQAWVVVTNDKTGAERRVGISSAGLPLQSIRTLGSDGRGNVYVMVQVFGERWDGTPSWYFLRLSPTGMFLGQLRLPQDSWAGSGYTVVPSGRILELRSTEAGIIVSEYELE